MMQRVLIRKPGSYDRLELVSETAPVPKAGEVRVLTQAIGVNYADCIVRMGLYSSASKYVGWPITPGFEFAGEIDLVGEGVTAWKPGDRVFGLTRFGGYASHVVVPSSQLFRIPPHFSMQRAAAFPTVHLTAWYALCGLAHPRRNQKVLVHSAAGGVGTAALKICRHLGMTTLAVVGSEHKRETARQAGADFVIVRDTENLWHVVERLAPDGLDVVLESSGAATLRPSYAHLAATGHLIVFGLASMLPRGGRRVSWPRLAWHYLKLPRFGVLDLLDENKSVSGFNLSYLFDKQEQLHDGMTTLLNWEAEGALSEPPIRSYPLAEAATAQRDLESGNTVGKLVLIP